MRMWREWSSWESWELLWLLWGGECWCGLPSSALGKSLNMRIMTHGQVRLLQSCDVGGWQVACTWLLVRWLGTALRFGSDGCCWFLPVCLGIC